MSSKKVILITGANTGIGLESVKFLLRSPAVYHIIVGSRSVEKGRAAITDLVAAFSDSPSTLELLQIDVCDDGSIERAFRDVSNKHDRIDVLINNAGATFDHEVQTDSISIRQSFLKAYDVNVAGAQVMTHIFAPLLIKSADPRLLFITSGLSSLQNCSAAFMPFGKVEIPAGWPKQMASVPIGYRSSKAALNMAMLAWHWVLEKDGVKTWCISPGFLATNLGGSVEALKALGAGDPAAGGEFIKDVVEGKRDGDAGKVITAAGVQSW